MRKLSPIALSVTSLVALLSAAGCSSSDSGGGGDNLTPFVPGGAGATATGAGGATVTGAGGTGNAVGAAGSTAEGQGGSALIGAGGTAVASGGTAGAPPGQEVTAAPPPLGYFTSGGWNGYAFTATNVVGTTITPATFETLPAGQPFCVSGSVAADPDFAGVSLLGFNVNQAQQPAAGETDPAVGTTVPQGTGIAVSFTKTLAAPLRIQIQGPNGDTLASDRWCYEIQETGGPVFAPYAEFNTTCWAPTTGTAYAGQPITAVLFTVPGVDTAATPYGYCIDGFADGSSVADAPASITESVALSGTLSTKFARARVTGADGKSYIVQNNAWNDASAEGAQVLQFTGNSFQVARQNAGGAGDVPLGFPSIYVGANGFRGANDSLTTKLDDHLPIQVSAIQSVQTRFSHNATGGDANATYDVWFAAQPPTGEYQTASGAFLMVWTYKPTNRNAIGGFGGGAAQTATVDGKTWNLFVGGRAEAGDPGAGNAQVISYVVPGGAITDYTFDLNLFIKDAVQRGLISPTMYLTDVFAGFEIWSGGSGLRINDFTVNVQ
jgi:glycosyl hydrolase family 12